MDEETFAAIAAKEIGRVLQPIAAEENQALKKLIRRSRKEKSDNYMDFALSEGRALTPSMWAGYLLGLIDSWALVTPKFTQLLPIRRQKYLEVGETLAHRLVTAATNVLTALGDLDRAKCSPAFYRFAQLIDEAGKPEKSLGLVAFAIEFGAPEDADREEVVRYAANLAKIHGRPEVVAAVSVHLAVALVHAAVRAPNRRLEAFDSVETAFERLRLAPANSREGAATALLRSIEDEDYLEPFKLPLCLMVPACESHADLAQLFARPSWPERISDAPLADWWDRDGPARRARWQEMQIDLARLKLEPLRRPAAVGTDWTSWIFSHPAYRRAIPHSQSFLREADFERLVLVLSHEITHVLSLIGAVGNALNCLRVAAYDAELTMWAATPDMTSPERLREAVVAQGLATQQDGDAGSLFRAEQGVELSLKAKILQDVWTPWFEGLAVFGEMAADPALDQERNTPVTQALRNLIDLRWTPSAEEGTSIPSSVTESIADFEARCSQAIARLGPDRLRMYASGTDAPYLAGYLAVRAVVAAWRARRLQGLSGTEAFMLLLDATRFDTFDAIPDLSLRSDLFAAEAEAHMVAWAARLAQLDAESLGAFLDVPTANIKDFRYLWKGGKFQRRPFDPTVQRDTFNDEGRQRLRQAMASLTRPEDADRIRNPTEDSAALVAHAAQTMAQHFTTDSFEELLADATKRVGMIGLIGGLLPIGTTAGRFFLNVDPVQQRAALSALIVSTEEHVEDRGPSINVHTMPIAHTAAEKIAESHRLLGKPRLDVTRLIELTGMALGDRRTTGIHVFAFRYGEWFEVRGPTTMVDQAIQANPDNYSDLCKLVRARLHPDQLDLRELETIARGEKGAERTRDWIERSKLWHVKDEPFEVADWAARVRRVAQEVLDASARRPRQHRAGEALLLGLFGDKKLAQALARKSLDQLTTLVPQRRSDIILGLFRTAQRPSSDVAASVAAQALAACGVPLLAKTPQGWDVRSAIRFD